MNCVFITRNDKVFLPAFFENFFSKANCTDNFRVLLVRPVYKNETTFSMAIKYLKTFGLKEFIFFSSEIVFRKILGMLRKPKRGGKFYSVSAVAEAFGHKTFFIDGDVNEPPVLEMLKAWSTDLIVSVGCPQIFKNQIIHLPKLGCLNLHGAPLPNYRGVLPSFRLLKKNEKYAANTLFFVNEIIDGGDILFQEKFPIQDEDTLRSLIFRSKLRASEMVLKAIEMIRDGNVVTRPIEVEGGSYYGWPKRKDVLDFLAQGRRLR